MSEISADLIRELAAGAEQYQTGYDEYQLLDMAARRWADADALTGPTRPTIDGIKRYLDDVVRGVIKDAAQEHTDVTAITLTFATEQLLTYLMLKLGWTIPPEYTIPLKLLSALVYRRMLKELGDRM